MNIYLVERNDKIRYDEYDAAVVAAESPEQAIKLLKDKHGVDPTGTWRYFDVTVTRVVPTKPKIILESFNAG
ncbi:MAG: hypothetical protein ABFD50_20050 [Smithella sp.]